VFPDGKGDFFLYVRFLFGILIRTMETGLTPKQMQILEWIESYLRNRHTMPSRREIASGLGLSSPATIQQHIEALEKKGYLKRGGERESRALQWTARSKRLFSSQSESQSGPDSRTGEADEAIVELPLLGTIAAGHPIEVYPDPQLKSIPLRLFSRNWMQDPSQDHYLLSVRGDSMLGDGILHGDWVILKRAKEARSGETVAALLNGEATLKRLYKNRDRVELHPANPQYPVIPVRPSDRFEIQGILIGLIRKYS
jgi:repressor LexA